MKSQNRISSLTLELYYRGLATNKERKLVERALVTDNEVYKRYKALQESERELRQLVTQELNRLNIPERPSVPPSRNKKYVVGFILAALLLCAFVSTFLYLKSSEASTDTIIVDIEDIPNNEIVVSAEPPIEQEKSIPQEKIKIVEKPRTEPVKETKPELPNIPEKGVSIAEVPAPDTGVRLRGGDQPNINIPPGITFIFENMFADRGLTFVIIPARITSIGKNAFSGNPLLSVTIGADVSIEDNAIPGAFAAVYNANGKAAGTYTRPDINSEAWEKR